MVGESSTERVGVYEGFLFVVSQTFGAYLILCYLQTLQSYRARSMTSSF